MTASYSKLMLDHARIDHLCRMLVDDVSMLGKDAAECRKYLEELTCLISEHIKVERFLIVTLQQNLVTEKWNGRLSNIIEVVNGLDLNNQNMLDNWTQEAITSDREEFRTAIKAFSSLCEQASAYEKDHFYRDALESAVITLR